MKRSMLGVSSAVLGGFTLSGCASKQRTALPSLGRSIALDSRRMVKKDKSRLSFITGNDTRDAAYKSLKPLENTIASAIGNKQVVIKPNAGVTGPQHHHEVADVNQLRGILDFLKPIYDKQIIVAEGSASQAVSMQYAFEEYGYTALEREYNVKLTDANDLPSSTREPNC